jgi:hypothetical protein
MKISQWDVAKVTIVLFYAGKPEVDAIEFFAIGTSTASMQ